MVNQVSINPSVELFNRYECLIPTDDKETDVSVMQIKGNWVKITGTLDSGAAESVCPMDFMPMIPVSSPSDGRTYVAANGTKIKDQGAKQIAFTTAEGNERRIKFCRTSVMKPLMSSSKVEAAGNRIVLDGPSNSYIECKKSGQRTRIRQQDGVYVIDMWINTDNAGPVFGRQGR